MKRLTLSLLLIAIVAFGYAQKKVNSKIKEVTVFQNGAQVFRTAATSLSKGRTEVVFSGLSMSIDPNSIQVKGVGKFSIMSVQHRYNYLVKEKVDKRIKEMQDSVKMLRAELDLQSRLNNALDQEAQMLLANKSIGGANTGVTAQQLQSMADFYRTRLKDIYTRMYKIQKANAERKQKIQKLTQQINQSRQNYQSRVSEIVLDIDVQESTQAKFMFNYLVNNAGWYPQYDIRAIDAHHPVELHYRAMIHQQTGVEWKDVQLTVSTGNPNANGVIPELFPWYLTYSTPYVRGSRAKAAITYEGAMAPMAVQEIESDMTSSDTLVVANKTYAKNSSSYTTVSESQTTALFKISTPYTIPSSGKTVNVKVQKVKLPADYRYYCVPKYSLDAYLQARITGWERLNLLPGRVNVFFEGTFVGKSYINPKNLNDTLNVSMGKDASIVLKRNKVKDKTGNQVMGSNKKMNLGWEISVRNGKKEKIHLVIQDQIPLSRNKEVEITLNENSGARVDEETGFLTWELDMEPGTTVKKRFDYTVKYPKKYTINNLW